MVGRMRILATAFLVLMASGTAQASSILVIDDNHRASGPSILRLDDTTPAASSPSLLTLGTTPARQDVDIIEEPAAAEAEVPQSIPDLPLVVRAGVEGPAFARSIPEESAEPAGAAPVTPAEPVTRALPEAPDAGASSAASPDAGASTTPTLKPE